MERPAENSCSREDLADFTFFALSNLEQIPDTMNVGLSHDYSINDYYKAVADVVGFTGQFKHDLSKPVGMQQKLVDISAQNKLGWKPSHSLEEGLQKTYQFFLDEVY